MHTQLDSIDGPTMQTSDLWFNQIESAYLIGPDWSILDHGSHSWCLIGPNSTSTYPRAENQIKSTGFTYA
jgi:hypothetical protein